MNFSQKNNIYNRGGLLRTVLIVLAIIIALGYFGFNLRDIVNSPMVQDNLDFTKEVILGIWNGFLKTPVMFIWNLIVGLLTKNS